MYVHVYICNCSLTVIYTCELHNVVYYNRLWDTV